MTNAFMTASARLLLVGVSALLSAGPGFGQTAAPSPQTAQTKQTDVDEDDPNSLLWAMQRAGYKSGWQRGQEIYYMKCWMCHNEYTIAADTAPPAPSLRDLFKRPLVGGQPVNDQNVAAYIRRGSGRMPAYTSTVLSDADITDLVTYLREKCGTFRTGGGCFDEHNPPPNPRYRAR
jgi:hypothetical protein